MLRGSKKSRKTWRLLVIGAITIAISLILNCNNKVLATDAERVSILDLNYKIDTSVHTYTGGERNAVVKIYNGKTKLKLNKDYTVTYKNNVEIGKAKVTVKGIGKYTGTIKKSYYIAPMKNKIRSVMFNSIFTKATITWTRDPKVSGYALYMSESKNGKYIKIKHITGNKTITYTKKNLDPNKMYYFKVSSYKVYGEKNIFSKKYSEPKSNTGLLAEIKLTSSSSGSNRNHNLKLASKKINGLVLKPGKMFNWFSVVGAASKANGYKTATIFEKGKSVQGYGGGVCQVSTTLYQAAKKSGLKIVERHTHSKAVTYTTTGKDATVVYGIKNLRIKNNKKYSIKFVTTSKGGSTTCKIYRIAD